MDWIGQGSLHEVKLHAKNKIPMQHPENLSSLDAGSSPLERVLGIGRLAVEVVNDNDHDHVASKRETSENV